MGLIVNFSESADLGKILAAHENSKYTNEALCALVNTVSFMILRDATVSSRPNASASSSARTYETLPQDPFHRDEQWSDISFFSKDKKTTRRSKEGHITALYNHYRCARLAPTFYASTAAVKTALRQLDTTGLSSEVLGALDQQRAEDYSFTFHPHSLPARQTLQKGWAEFTQEVFNLIPDSQKYAHIWREGQKDVVLHSNESHLLHARPSSGDKKNMLLSLDICPSVV